MKGMVTIIWLIVILVWLGISIQNGNMQTLIVLSIDILRLQWETIKLYAVPLVVTGAFFYFFSRE